MKFALTLVKPTHRVSMAAVCSDDDSKNPAWTQTTLFNQIGVLRLIFNSLDHLFSLGYATQINYNQTETIFTQI